MADIAKRLADNDLQQVLFNLLAGDRARGERGIACLPDRTIEFRDGVKRAADVARGLGCPQINCLAGLLPDSVSRDQAWDTVITTSLFPLTI